MELDWENKMDQIVNGIYLNSLLDSAPGNPLVWNQFLTELNKQLNCDSSFILVTDRVERKNTHFLFHTNISQEYQQRYENELNKLDSFNYFITKNPQRVLCNQISENFFTEDTQSDFTSPNDQKYRFGLSIPCNLNHSVSLLLNRQVLFNDEEKLNITEVLQAIIPSLKEALHAEQRHKISSQLLHYIGDHFDGYIIVDSQLKILFSDPVYSLIIGQFDCVDISENCLGLKNPSIERRVLSSLLKHEETTISIHNQCHSCHIIITPISFLQNLYKWECCKGGFILTFTHDKDKNPTVDRLLEIYDLTQCEAICALHFMKTPSIPDVAKNTFRSLETVRNHIKHIMQKMDVHNQAELMKKLLILSTL